MTPYEKELAALPVLREWLAVDSNSPTGLVWRKTATKGRAVAGKPAGSSEGKGYYRVIFNHTSYKCHRLVLWLSGIVPQPDQFCDHIDQNKSNNTVNNLRWVNHATNMTNTPVRNKHGFKYVNFNQKGGRYRAAWGRTEVDGVKMVYVGTYDTPYEAHIAALAHRLEHHWNP